MNEEDLLILRTILRKPIIDDYKQGLITSEWQFNDDGTIQIYAGYIKLWYYLHKDLIFRSDYESEDCLFNINSL